MLFLTFGESPDMIRSGGSYFNSWVDPEVILTDFSRRAISSIDKSEVIDVNCIKSPVLGSIPPERLSGGVKTLMAIKYTDIKVHLASMGDNCFPFLKEIADEKDVYVYSDRYRRLFDNGFTELTVLFEGSPYVMKSGLELMNFYVEKELYK